jgi:hypothetical protein
LASIDYIQLEFFAGYPFGYYKLRFLPDGTAEYTSAGEDLPFVMPNGYQWVTSKRVYQKLAKMILARLWEQEPDPRAELGIVLDGWTDRLSWSIEGVMEEQSFVIRKGPASLLKVMERIRRLVKDEEKNLPVMRMDPIEIPINFMSKWSP